MSLPLSRLLVAAFVTLLWAAGLAAQTSSPVSSTLAVAGNVEQPLSLTVADLKRYPAHQVDYAPGRGEHKGGPGPIRHYRGCLLRDVLAAARPVEGNPRELRKSYVVATAGDGYEVVFSWAELFLTPIGDGVYVVYERDGAALPDDEGRIALIVTSDARPVRHVKWLKALALRIA
ncbi:MAG TPA: molybdopterin-dependent oxidoreductase [Casimicrobiaceae bacterium]|nr:molybdopterin-dependent oxidoreductase [Casimicrobiaceae bacterium]